MVKARIIGAWGTNPLSSSDDMSKTARRDLHAVPGCKLERTTIRRAARGSLIPAICAALGHRGLRHLVYPCRTSPGDQAKRCARGPLVQVV